MDVEAAHYPKFKESLALKPHPNTAEPNFCSLFQDDNAWNIRANGTAKGHRLYSQERFPDGRHPLFKPPPGAPVFYDIDQGPKRGLATRLLDSSYSRSPCSWSHAPRFQPQPPTCGPKVGPGSYNAPRYPQNLSPVRKPPTAVAPYTRRTLSTSPTRRRAPGPYPYTHTSTYDDADLEEGSAVTPQARSASAAGGTRSGAGASQGGQTRPNTSGAQSAFSKPRGEELDAGAGGGAGAGAGAGAAAQQQEQQYQQQQYQQQQQQQQRRRLQSSHSQPQIGSRLYGRPQTRGQLQDMLMRYQRSRAVAQSRRIVRRRKNRESDPLIDKADANTRSWNYRSSFGGTSIDARGFSIPTSPRFADVLKLRKVAAQRPGPGQYYKASSMLKAPVYAQDPRNEFPVRRRRRRKGRPSKAKTAPLYSYQ